MSQQIAAVIKDSRRALLEHAVYGRLETAGHLAVFMEFHVFAVWDFMSLLKALQLKLTCVETPWVPTGDARVRRLVNEIVLGEESDLGHDGVAASHFELYLNAMDEAGADTGPIKSFVELLKGGTSIRDALRLVRAPDAATSFVLHTFDVIENGKPHEIAAAFTYGREDLIPDLFGALVSRLSSDFPGRFEILRYYLDRHIELDGDEHGELGREMVSLLCGGDIRREREAADAAAKALKVRLKLWDGIFERLNKGHAES